MRALAATEFNGTPIDLEILTDLRENWEAIKLDIIADIDQRYRCYDGTTFKLDLFAEFLRREGIRNWPVTDCGRLSKSDKTFKEMAQAYPQLQPLRELNYTISKMRLEKLAVGSDGRNRCSLWAFSTKTSRNAPEATKFIYGPSTWLRSLIKPKDGFAVAYLDWQAQEFAIAAVLSGDPEMIGSYLSGDPYLAFGKAIDGIPQSATKDTHSRERDAFKLCLLGILYGMQAKGLAAYTGLSERVAERILKSHKQLYKRFWQWSEESLEMAILKGRMVTCYGWRFSAPWKAAKPDPKHRRGIPVRTLRNWPVQATASEMFRLACCLMFERGVHTCAQVHDAVLVEARIEEIDEVINIARIAMTEASREVFKDKLELRVDAKKFTDRYFDKRGASMWQTVMKILDARRQKLRPEQEPSAMKILLEGNNQAGAGLLS
jgi:hypothetical protein